MVQSNFVTAHTNIVIGLVETIVGLIPAGGGCKEMLWRWSSTSEAKNDPDIVLPTEDIILDHWSKIKQKWKVIKSQN